MADYGLKGKFEIRKVRSEFAGRIVGDEMWESDLKRDVDVGIKSRTDTLWRYRVSFQADAENGSLRREVVCYLDIVFGSSCGVPSCIIDQSMHCERVLVIGLTNQAEKLPCGHQHFSTDCPSARPPCPDGKVIVSPLFG